MKRMLIIGSILASGNLLTACNQQSKSSETPKPAIREEAVHYQADGVSMTGYAAYDSSSNAKRPAILVVHEWWGLNDYIKRRVRDLAELGYIAMAADMYGNGVIVGNPDEAGKTAGAFYADPQMARQRFDAALEQLKSYPETDPDNIAAIGYCFGGSMVLNMAKLGEDLKGVVSFHGGLDGVPANKDLLKAKILVCHGADDPFVKPEEVSKFRNQLDSIGADYKFIEYPGAVHAFTNPDATETGKKFNIPIAYNAQADSASWKDMQDFFDKIFVPGGNQSN